MSQAGIPKADCDMILDWYSMHVPQNVGDEARDNEQNSKGVKGAVKSDSRLTLPLC